MNDGQKAVALIITAADIKEKGIFEIARKINIEFVMKRRGMEICLDDLIEEVSIGTDMTDEECIDLLFGELRDYDSNFQEYFIEGYNLQGCLINVFDNPQRFIIEMVSHLTCFMLYRIENFYLNKPHNERKHENVISSPSKRNYEEFHIVEGIDLTETFYEKYLSYIRQLDEPDDPYDERWISNRRY